MFTYPYVGMADRQRTTFKRRRPRSRASSRRQTRVRFSFRNDSYHVAHTHSDTRGNGRPPPTRCRRVHRCFYCRRKYVFLVRSIIDRLSNRRPRHGSGSPATVPSDGRPVRSRPRRLFLPCVVSTRDRPSIASQYTNDRFYPRSRSTRLPVWVVAPRMNKKPRV